MNNLKDFNSFLNENQNNMQWFRGYTTNTKELNYIWVTSDENHAKQYAAINKATYGGDTIIDKLNIDLNNLNVLDLSMYDMDEYIDENSADDILTDISVDYDYSNLFDIVEDEIPTSRLINAILDKIMLNTDALKIFENGILTLCINKNKI